MNNKPSIWRRIWRHPAGKTGIILFAGFVLLLIFVPNVEPEVTQVKTASETRESAKSQKVEDVENEDKKETEQKSDDTEVTSTARTSNDPQSSVAQENETTPVEEDSSNDTQPENTQYAVVKVVDGDTVDLSINGATERIRLIGLDTPETVDPRKPVECFGVEASNYAKSVLTGKKVSLEKDSSQGERDAYGRLLGYIVLSNGTNFNKLMISEGYGYEYTYNTPYKYQAEFKAAQRQAESLGKGLWAPGTCEEEETTQEEEQPATTSGEKWYVSSHHSSQYYYCEESDSWKSLSETYLKIYNSEAALLADFPNHTLHESCQ